MGAKKLGKNVKGWNGIVGDDVNRHGEGWNDGDDDDGNDDVDDNDDVDVGDDENEDDGFVVVVVPW